MERVLTFEPSSPEAGGQCLQSIDMTGFLTFALSALQRYFAAGGAIFCVFADFRFYTNAIYLHQVYQFPRRLLPRSYRLPPD